MFGRSFRLPLSLLGIPVYVDLSFLIVLPLLAWIIGSQLAIFAHMFGIPLSESMMTGAAPYGLGLIAAIGLFVSVLIHELGHAVTARGYGVKVRRITLWFLGGVAQFEEIPKQRGAEAVVSIVGPLVSAAIGVICWLALRAVDADAPAVRFVLAYLAYMNIVLAIFNLLPALPLDGGRVLRSLLALAMPYGEATQVAGGVSKFLAVIMGLFGLFSLNFFLLLVAIFIYAAVSAETRTGQLEELLRGALVRDLMNPQVATVTPDLRVADLTQRMLHDHHLGFPVTDSSGNVLGLVTLRDLQGKDPAIQVRDVMHTDVPKLPEQATAVEALRLMSHNEFGRVIATRDGGQMSGIITKTDLMRLIRIRMVGWGLGHHGMTSGYDMTSGHGAAPV
jgi:Zn-dependent protease